MPALGRHRFNTAEYYRMAETGVLKPDARVELLDGEILDRSPIGPFHGGIVNRLARLLTKLLEHRCLVVVQNPLQLDEHSEPQPDVMLVKSAGHDYTTHHPRPGDVFLLIEVADSTLDKDRDLKLPLYGRAGVAEVWMVDLQQLALEVYRDPHLTGYGSVTILRPGDHAHVAAFPDVAVDIAALLKRG